MANYKLITPPASYPITVDEVKADRRVTHSVDDTRIAAMIAAATSVAEQLTRRALVQQTWMMTLDIFPSAFTIDKTPVQSITSLTYFDSQGILQTLAADQYSLDNSSYSGPAYVVPALNVSWPSTRDQINSVMLTFVAGYAAVPAEVKAWMLLYVGTMYEHRELITDRQPFEMRWAESLLDPVRVSYP